MASLAFISPHVHEQTGKSRTPLLRTIKSKCKQRCRESSGRCFMSAMRKRCESHFKTARRERLKRRLRIEINKYCPVQERWINNCAISYWHFNFLISARRRLHAGFPLRIYSRRLQFSCTIAKIKRDRWPSICLSSQLMALWDGSPHLHASALSCSVIDMMKGEM